MDLMELLERGDVEAFNAKRPESGKIDLFAADLPEKSLAGVDLARATLDKSDLTGTDLSDATLAGASLAGVDGSGLKLTNALAIKVRMTEAQLDGADLSGGDFTKANFSEAVLDGSNAERVVLAGARLVGASIREANWQDADLVEAGLHKANFGGTDLRRGDLSEVSAHEAKFDGARLDGATGTHGRFVGASFVGASLVGVRMIGADLADADLSGADLSNADLSGANLTGAKLTGARLTNAVLADACLDGVSLSGVDVSGADLSGVDPTMLGLTDAQRAVVAALGVEPPATPVASRGVAASANGSLVALLWENLDGVGEPEGESDEPTPICTLRYALFGAGGEIARGVLPVPADKVLARAIGADGDGFLVVVLRDRPGGVALVCYRLDARGQLAGTVTSALGYDPMVWPVIGRDGGPVVYGLARSGPTLVAQRTDGTGPAVAFNARVPTAQGFLGTHHPVISCKGGVVQAAGPKTAGTPRRTPDGFPGRLGSAVPLGDRILCGWLVERQGDTPGGLRTAFLEKRGAPETEVLTNSDRVASLDLLGVGEVGWLAWVEVTAGAAQAWRCQFPGGTPEKVAVGIDAARVGFATVTSGVPPLVLTTPRGALILVDTSGARHELR